MNLNYELALLWEHLVEFKISAKLKDEFTHV